MKLSKARRRLKRAQRRLRRAQGKVDRLLGAVIKGEHKRASTLDAIGVDPTLAPERACPRGDFST